MNIVINKWIISGGLIFVGTVLLYLILRFISKMTDRRLAQLENRQHLQSVSSGSAVGDRGPVTRERGVESIERTASVTRRFLIPLVISLTLMIALVPLLDSVSSAVVSVVIGATTVVFGIAVRPVLENGIAGLVISNSKVISVGDTVKLDDLYGVVVDIAPTHTVIRLWDWRRYVVPNSRLIQQPILNYTLTDRQVMASAEFWVSHAANLDEVKEIGFGIINASKNGISEQEPAFWVLELGERAVKCRLAGWSESPADAWALSHDIRVGIIRAMQSEGIDAHLNKHQMEQTTEAKRPDEVSK
jgi:small-conductance mechanosensitive channel